MIQAHDPNLLWLRIFAHAGLALAFSTFSIVSIWLATHKFIGHRKLLISFAVFMTVNSFNSVALMVGIYRGNAQNAVSVGILVFRMAAGIFWATQTLLSLDDIKATLTEAEAEEMLRRDKTSDEKQKHELMEMLAAANKTSSMEALAAAATRRVNAVR